MPEKPVDIAIFIRSFHGGGAEKVMLLLIKNFIERGLTVDLLLPRAKGQYLEQLPPQVRLIDFKSPWIAASLPKLVDYLRRERPKALLAALHYPSEIAIIAKHLARVPTKVVVVEQNTLSVEAKNSFQLSVRLNPLGAKIFYPLADKIVAASHGVAKDLAFTASLNPETIKVIYNPCIAREIYQKAREPVAHPWLQPEQPPVILGVGRLHPQKDFPTLIRAFARVRQITPAKLIILGIGSEEAALKALATQLGLENDLAFLGFVQNPYAYMARASVFAMSSIYEGFGMVLVEALALGIPTIATDCPNGPSEILDGGKYGLLTPVGNIELMAQSIVKALNSQTNKADSQWLEQFTIEAISEKYLEVLGFNFTSRQKKVNTGVE
jgi:glycosyltransferase involved in cell wall biosynthesis